MGEVFPQCQECHHARPACGEPMHETGTQLVVPALRVSIISLTLEPPPQLLAVN